MIGYIMKKLFEGLLFFIILCIYVNSSFCGEAKDVSLGIHFMVGGRYDNMRMCVGSEAGIKGGPIADIMFDTRFRVNDKLSIAFNLPIMRPILFAAAFKMLQFEPQFSFEFRKNIKEDKDLIIGPALGASFHYGPDYKSDKENKGDSFFAVGPFISGLFGYQFKGSSGKNKIFGLRAFYVPLFSGESDLSPGTVIGGALEGHFRFR